MKVIFLDIDGVLNCERFYIERRARRVAANAFPILTRDYTDEFCPLLVSNLNALTDITQAKLVISSTWRSDGIPKLKRIFEQARITGEIIDTTGFDRKRHRGTEIANWLASNQVDRYVILDDDRDMFAWQNFVHCPFKDGLTWDKALKAMSFLQK